MSHSTTLLNLLIKRGPLTANQMVKATGLSIRQVHDAMQSLRVRKAMEAVDRPYRVTDAGRDMAQNREDRAQRLAAKAAEPKRPVGRPRKKRVDPNLAGALQSRPALQMAWGAMHA